MKKYKIVKILGEGSFGIVVEARKKRTKEKVAIKYISDYDSSEYGALKTVREIQILKKLTEIPENVYTVKILDLIEPTKEALEKSSLKGNGIFIVMEHMEIDLREFLTLYRES